MSNRIHALATALTLTLATLGQAGAAEPAGQPTFFVPAVIGAAFHDARVATTPAEVRRQGGFASAGAAQWLPAAPEEAPVAGTFYLPAVVGAAFHDPRVATTPAEVRRQGGFASAGAVQWLPAAPAEAEAKSKTVKVGAL